MNKISKNTSQKPNLSQIEAYLGQVCISKTKCRYTPHSMNALNTMHWAERRAWKKAWQEAVLAEMNYNRTGKYYSFVEIIVKTTHRQDKDNLYCSIKGVLDGLRYAKWIKDDDEESIFLKVKQKKVNKRDQQGVIIVLN